MSRATQSIFGLAGVVLPFAGAAAPAGWLLCNGQAVSRTAYAHLFTTIGTAHGAGDGSTTFNVPDTRGEFIRGVDAGRGVDVGRPLGSAQVATSIRTNGIDSIADATYARPTPIVNYSDRDEGVMGERLLILKTQTVTEAIQYTHSSVRPRNVALNHIIKT